MENGSATELAWLCGPACFGHMEQTFDSKLMQTAVESLRNSYLR